MDEKLNVIAFAGPPALPILAAEAQGLYRARGMDIVITFAQNSTELRDGLAAGRYQLAQSAIDNAFALQDKGHADIAVVLGGDNGFNRLIVRPEINSFADIKGRTVAVDAPHTAFALQLYEMLRRNGVNEGDYAVKPAGSSAARLALMSEDKDAVAAMLIPPFSLFAREKGFRDMGSAAAALGTYQGSSIFALRPWAAAHADTVVKFLQATIEGFRWVLDSGNKADVIALMAERLAMSGDIAAVTYEGMIDDFSPDGTFDMTGIRNVLALRAAFEGRPAGEPDSYLDLNYYRQALAGLS